MDHLNDEFHKIVFQQISMKPYGFFLQNLIELLTFRIVQLNIVSTTKLLQNTAIHSTTVNCYWCRVHAKTGHIDFD